MRELLESKEAARQWLEQLPVREKLRLLEKLRDFSLLLAPGRRGARLYQRHGSRRGRFADSQAAKRLGKRWCENE
jgi:hypothetical protein